MLRCLLAASLAATAIAMPVGFALTARPAQAQIQFQRSFPADALRGQVTFVGNLAGDVVLNEKAVRLAPGTRIRDHNNMMVMSSTLKDQAFIVHYTRDMLGQPKDIWLLRPEEVKRTIWPSNAQEARTWGFNATTQVWIKP